MSTDAEKIGLYNKIFDYIKEQNRINFYPKTLDIKEYLKINNIDLSVRTIVRYLDGIRSVFDIDIEKTSHKGGYCIKEEVSNSNPIYQSLQILNNIFFYKNKLNKSIRLLNYFSFDKVENNGFNRIDDVLKAIISKNIISIDYQRFYKGEVATRELKPHLLKEYLGKWYLIGLDLSKNKIRSFSLDKIKELIILDKKFKVQNTDKIKSQFDNTIGVIYKKPERVVLSFTQEQGNAFKENPWHNNYKIIDDKNNRLVVELYLSINYDLEQKILMHHNYVKVIEPEFLVKRIRDYSKKILEQYS